MSRVFVSCVGNTLAILKGNTLTIEGSTVARVWERNGELRIQHNAASQNGRIFLHTGEEMPFEQYSESYAIIPKGYGLRAESKRSGSKVERLVRVVPLQ